MRSIIAVETWEEQGDEDIQKIRYTEYFGDSIQITGKDIIDIFLDEEYVIEMMENSSSNVYTIEDIETLENILYMNSMINTIYLMSSGEWQFLTKAHEQVGRPEYRGGDWFNLASLITD